MKRGSQLKNSLKAKRDQALKRPELRGALFTAVEDGLPESGRKCEVKAQDVNGVYLLPKPAALSAHGQWRNAETGHELAVRIIWWRYWGPTS